ncbi:hypothetical protein [Dyella sp. 20L07]|uniref:hypothetical protein n=1 Tax=Dyella sp. 20L07 TaxID=3384240 RepID=UPI003D26E051
MPHETDELRTRWMQAFDELLDLYRLLEKENELLRAQLRRHTAGEMQIRETERRMLEIRGVSQPLLQERLHALLALRPSEAPPMR